MSWVVGRMRGWLARHPVAGPPEAPGPLPEREALLAEQGRLLRLRRSRFLRSPADAEDEAAEREVERQWQECQRGLAGFRRE